MLVLHVLTCASIFSGAAAPAPPALTPPDATERTAVARRWVREHAEAIIYTAIIFRLTPDVVDSVVTDTWHTIRTNAPNPDRVRRQRRRLARVSEITGVGYSPRMVGLAGLMLRSLQMATKIRRAFNPSLGYGAGAMLAAAYAQREWIPCLLFGWGVGGIYWSLFRVRPPGVDHEKFEYH